jgi:hypothetical protein
MKDKYKIPIMEPHKDGCPFYGEDGIWDEVIEKDGTHKKCNCGRKEVNN